MQTMKMLPYYYNGQLVRSRQILVPSIRLQASGTKSAAYHVCNSSHSHRSTNIWATAPPPQCLYPGQKRSFRPGAPFPESRLFSTAMRRLKSCFLGPTGGAASEQEESAETSRKQGGISSYYLFHSTSEQQHELQESQEAPPEGSITSTNKNNIMSMAESSSPRSKRARMISSGKKYLLTVDQGTTSSRCLLFDFQFKHVRTAQEEFPQYYPKPGWVEHDATEIATSVKNCMQKLETSQSEVAAIGIANQRETTVAWDRDTGKPLHKAIVWMDTRTHDVVHKLIAKYNGNKDHFRASTGLPISTYFSGLKIRWLLENVPAVKAAHDAGRCCFGTIDSWLVHLMTGKHVTDVSNAARYMLMDLATQKWDANILKELGIREESLPKIVSNVYDFGTVRPEFSKALAGVPVTGMLGDQHAALVGQCCFAPGEAKNTYGTGCFMIANTGTKIVPSTKGLLTTIGYQMGSRSDTIFALEGSVAIAGRLIQWLRDNLQIIRDAPEAEKLAKQCESSGGVVIVPAFQGLFAPYWRDDARAVICGMTLQAGRPEMCRAALDAVALQVCDIFSAMEGDGITVKQLRVDGGMTVNETLMQTQADLLGVAVQRPSMVETTALGAVIAAAIGVGLYNSVEEVKQVCSRSTSLTTFSAKIAPPERKKVRENWAKAVAKSVQDHANL